MNADGSGEARELPTTGDLFKWPEDWTRDGHTLVFSNISSATYDDIWITSPSVDGKPTPLLETRFRERTARVSPDGRWIAYRSDEAGPYDVYIQSFPKIGHKVRVSRDGALGLWWMPGSDELCYLTLNSDAVMSVSLRRNGADLDPGEPGLLFRTPAGTNGIDFTQDGQRVLVSVPSAGEEARKLRIILDWSGLVKR